MKTITIKHFRTGNTLFTGRFSGIRQAVETAISENTPLAFADLRHANLVNALMDGAILDNALLDEANLMGANLSEASLRHTSLINAQLYNTILCESVLDGIQCRGALFGGTDISGARISRCLFDTLSALDLNFRDTAFMDANSFAAGNNYMCEFSRPPLVLKGLPFPITCFERSLLIGHYALPDITPAAPAQMPSVLFNFIRNHSALISTLWQVYQGDNRRTA